MSNLGKTGKIYLDCYEGECTTSTQSECEDGPCTSYHYYVDHRCSNECRKTGFYKCSDSFCSGYVGHYEGNRCFRDFDDELEDNKTSCNADNLILNWKGLYYSKTNATTYGIYSYLNNAVSSNDSCPYGRRMCGVLDELGNKLCYPDGLACPINYVTTNLSEINEHTTIYSAVTLGDKKIYYTNYATDGKVLGGLFVDTDLKINYNDIDCKTLDTSTISELLLHNYNKLYRNSLDFDPYDEETSELKKRGKSYCFYRNLCYYYKR